MKRNRKNLYVSIMIALSLFCWGCSSALPETKQSDQSVINMPSAEKESPSDKKSQDLASTALSFLKDFEEKYPDRSAGTDQEFKAAEHLLAKLESMGLSPTVLPFDYETDWAKKQHSQNIEVRIESASKSETPNDSYILLGAHYDSVPKGSGADDNASGVSLLIAIGEYLIKQPIQKDVVLVFFGAEEVGLKGSEAYVRHLDSGHLQYPSLMINYDSLIAGDFTYAYGSSTHPENLAALLKLANDAQLDLLTQDLAASGLPYGETLDASDHAAFKALGIPYLYFEATNWTLGKQDGYTQTDHPKVEGGEIWHTKNDKLPFIEKTFPGRPYHHLDLFIKSTLLYLESFYFE